MKKEELPKFATNITAFCAETANLIADFGL
jgi:hypothetical protein